MSKRHQWKQPAKPQEPREPYRATKRSDKEAQNLPPHLARKHGQQMSASQQR